LKISDFGMTTSDGPMRAGGGAVARCVVCLECRSAAKPGGRIGGLDAGEAPQFVAGLGKERIALSFGLGRKQSIQQADLAAHEP
jgi:hypothetical protein